LVETILNDLPQHIRDLDSHQVTVFYESMGVILHSVQDQSKRDSLLIKLMLLPNRFWDQIMVKARSDVNSLNDEITIRRLNDILKTNIAVCQTMGTFFLPQLFKMHSDLMSIYRHYSKGVSDYIQLNGPMSVKDQTPKLLRTIRKNILLLYTKFTDAKSSEPVLIAEKFVPSLMESILKDYQDSIPQAREPEALSIFASLIAKLGANKKSHPLLVQQVPTILDHVFEPTLKAISNNFEEHPETRMAFYTVLKNINDHSFESILAFNDEQTTTLVDSVMWAIRHLVTDVSDCGMGLFLGLITKMANSPKCDSFFQQHLIKLLDRLLSVLTDTFHKNNFKMHAMTLQRIISIVESPRLGVQLYPPGMFSSNSEFLHAHMVKVLSQAFPNVHPNEVKIFVDGLYATKLEPPKFKQFMRDFIIQTKEFSIGGNEEFYAEEKAQTEVLKEQELHSIPGMAAPE